MDNLDLVTEENIKRKQLQKRGGESPMSFMKREKKSEGQIEEKGEGGKKEGERRRRKEGSKKEKTFFFFSQSVSLRSLE